MTIFLCALFIGAAAGLIGLSCTRAAKLSSLAKMLNLRFDRERDTITTDSTAGHLEFFSHFFRQYFNVFTFSDAHAYMRMADVHFFFDDNPKSKPLCLTVFTAEMKRAQFPPLKITPKKSPFDASKYTLEATKPPLNETYRVRANSSQAAVLLTPSLLTLLKKHTNLYIEVNDNAFMYHEHGIVGVEDLQTFRLRAIQILQEMQRALAASQQTADVKQNPSKSASAQETNTLDKAEAMLAALRMGAGPMPAEHSPKKWLGAGIALLVIGAAAVSILAWTVMNRLHP